MLYNNGLVMLLNDFYLVIRGSWLKVKLRFMVVRCHFFNMVRLFVVVRVQVWVLKSMKGGLFMEFNWLHFSCNLLGLLYYFLRSNLRLRYDRLSDVKRFLMYLRCAVVDSLIDRVWIQMIMRAFVLNVTLMTVIQVKWVVTMRVRVIKSMENGVLFIVSRLNIVLIVILVLQFRMCHMHRLIFNILMDYLMFRIVLLLLKKSGIHMHSRVENGKLFVINWLLAVGDISPVVFWLVMLRLLTSYIEMNLRLCTCLSKRMFIRSLFIIKVSVSRMDGLVVSYYRFMVDLMMKRCIVFIMNGLVRHKRVISRLRKNDCLRMSFR